MIFSINAKPFSFIFHASNIFIQMHNRAGCSQACQTLNAQSPIALKAWAPLQ